MYDKFEPFQQIDKQNFGFTPTRYEIWDTGKKIANGRTNSPIFAEVSTIDGIEKVVVNFIDSQLNNQIAIKNTFDIFITARERLQLLIIPNQTNAVANMAIQMFKNLIGPTREFKNFNSDEPYCCNLFLINGNIDKITFSFSSPEKLIEFYAD